MKAYHLTPARNLPGILLGGLLARRGRRSRGCGEPAPGVWLFVDRAGLEYGIDNWLENMFSERTKLALLAIDVTGAALDVDGIEARCVFDITPDRITVLSRNIDDLVLADIPD